MEDKFLITPKPTDAPALFGSAILSLSLLSECIMKFTFGDQNVDIILRKVIENY